MFQFRLRAAGVLIGLWCTLPAAAIAAPAYPVMDDATSQNLLSLAAARYEAYLANPAAVFSRGNPVKPGCSVDAALLNRLASSINSNDDPPMKRFLTLEGRSTGLGDMRIEASGQIITLVSAPCVKGKMEGTVEYWVEYDSSVIAAVANTNQRRLVHVVVDIRNGVQDGPAVVDTSVLHHEVVYNDPATRQMMAASKMPAVTASATFAAIMPRQGDSAEAPRVAISTVTIDGKANESIDEIRAAGPDRWTHIHYGSFGPLSHKDFTQGYKNNRRHGQFVTYAGMMGTFPTPAKTECWVDGEQVMTTACDAQ